jgi:hypothetical protein
MAEPFWTNDPGNRVSSRRLKCSNIENVGKMERNALIFSKKRPDSDTLRDCPLKEEFPLISHVLT